MGSNRTNTGDYIIGAIRVIDDALHQVASFRHVRVRTIQPTVTCFGIRADGG
jgi:hypothetical protein